jgi:hypothetical protein
MAVSVLSAAVAPAGFFGRHHDSLEQTHVIEMQAAVQSFVPLETALQPLPPAASAAGVRPESSPCSCAPPLPFPPVPSP